MHNWITIISFTYSTEAHLVKTHLESYGIEVLIKDELTAQVNNFYSNAIGGVKLQVKEFDYKNAHQILVESGYIKELEYKPNSFLIKFEKLTSKLPLIGKSLIELRLLIAVTIILIIIIVPIVIFSLPTTLDKLTENSWCVDRIIYKGQELTPNSLGLKMVSEYENCSETMVFRKNGIVDFPGINSYSESYNWELRKDSLIITEWKKSNDNELNNDHTIVEKKENKVESIYFGAYKLEIKNNKIEMRSDNLVIYGKVYSFNFSF